jgi:hypothetical protein
MLRMVPLPRYRGGGCTTPFSRCICIRVISTHTASRSRWSVMERREAPGSWATPRERALPPARASGVARATDQPACANRLLRARCASRRSTDTNTWAFRPSDWPWPAANLQARKQRVYISKKDNCQVKRDHTRRHPRHCEARRAEAIQGPLALRAGLLRFARNDETGCSASLRSWRNRQPRGWRRGFR